MVKLICLVSRPASQLADEFRGWWLDHHAQVAARLPGLRRYTISVIRQPNGNCRYDGVAELWFDDESAVSNAFASPQGLVCSREDRELLGDRLAFLTDEHVIVDAG